MIDGDILRYEVGFAAETVANGGQPDWELASNILFERMNRIWSETGATDYTVYLTPPGEKFRDVVAVTKKYKGHRVPNIPWHFNNLSVFLLNHFDCVFARPGLEADDEMAIAHNTVDTVVCSRDKDLRQLNGWSYGWEVGRQPRFGPIYITDENSHVELSKDRRKLDGTGKMFFYGQLLVGDKADNIPGLEKCGPVKAAEILKGKGLEEAWEAVKAAYQERYKATWQERLEEQGRLLWLLRAPEAHWSIEVEDMVAWISFTTT